MRAGKGLGRALAPGRSCYKPTRVDSRCDWGDGRAMIMLRSALFAGFLGGTLLLSGCGGGGGAVNSTVVAAPRGPSRVVRTPARPPARHVVPPARVHAMPGLEGVIGATGADLVRQFGLPRLDVLEGDARKLQYSANACVLDIYLYPPAPGREPQATYVDARRASDAREVDRAACVAAMRAAGRRR